MGNFVENSLGIRLVRIEPGQFTMGQDDGDWDEVPLHKVSLTQSSYMAETPVTNAQYEQFRPDHAEYRGIAGDSEDDDAAVLFVSWHDAVAFCAWISEREGKPYRLPTEAEWEYACRAGSTTPYWMGSILPPEYRIDNPDAWSSGMMADSPRDRLVVGQRGPNPWGLHDMHGLVEEWCHDWYGPYSGEDQENPVGYSTGDFKVTRGGSYETLAIHLRSANRLAALPGDQCRFIGFRVVQAPFPESEPLPRPTPPVFFRDVRQDPHEWESQIDQDRSFFADPIPYVIEPEDDDIPFYVHSHCPAITYCDNGDLIACWFNTNSERGREMLILASRLRNGATVWEPASLFLKAADRNMTGSGLFNIGGRILHLNGMEEAQTWTNLIMVQRESSDNGATWSQARIVSPEHEGFLHRWRNQVIACTRVLEDGTLVQLCDATPSGDGGTAVHISKDGGGTWTDLGLGKPFPRFRAGESGAWIAGIHASVVERRDGSLLAFGRGDTIDGQMAQSVSTDRGQTWSYSASPFPPISGGQRLVLVRLREGPLLFVGFTGDRKVVQEEEGGGLEFTDARGITRTGYGMFAALSFDDGASWTHYRLLSDGPARTLPSADFIRSFTMDATHAEPAGYLAAVQAPDGMIHLLSSHLHYRFNLAWLTAPFSWENE